MILEALPLEPDYGHAPRRRIVIASDAWTPQVNGVVRTLEATQAHLTAMGHQVTMISPEEFWSAPCPTYPEIRLSLALPGRVGRLIDAAAPDAIHISTEGPIGLAARRHCLHRGYRFTTAFHTKFAEYIHARTRFPTSWTYRALKWFHGPAEAVMCATGSLADELAGYGIAHTRRWSRGVDIDLFHPRRRQNPLSAELQNLPRPILLYVGRVAVEKNIEDFLRLPVLGSKVVVGGGPQLAALAAQYPAVRFTGPRFGDALADLYAAADVFVFPSLTDTFGLVILEALASGTPVAAYPVTGPKDIIGATAAGRLDEDLGRAITSALGASREACRRLALEYSWEACTRQFLANLAPVKP